MLNMIVAAAIFGTSALYGTDGLCVEPAIQGQAMTLASNGLSSKGLRELKRMKAMTRKGMSQAELAKCFGEPDYCVGEYLECRYASNKACTTGGTPGVLALVIRFDGNRIKRSDIMCVAE